MKYGKHLIALIAGCAVIALVISPAIAFAGASGSGGHPGCEMAGHLDRLEEQGYDISAIRAALESGDGETARTLMRQFMEEHRDELEMPAPPGDGNRMAGHLDRLEEQGYDVSAIRAALESGDGETARTLVRQFMEEHGDELDFPIPPHGGNRMAGHLGRLEEQGYDVSSIRAALESGDEETVRTLVRQFMEEHCDELDFPAPPGDGTCGAGMKLRTQCISPSGMSTRIN
ncbi:MAG: hypothetical protein JXA08_05765 [Methanomicrobiaceae archaeon]|nr:hypothetical protein [Methanomicrobiaceae archaeon]